MMLSSTLMVSFIENIFFIYSKCKTFKACFIINLSFIKVRRKEIIFRDGSKLARALLLKLAGHANLDGK